MAEETDYYALLAVSRSARPEEIAAAYRRLARAYHPDVSHAPGAADRMVAINRAYKVLSDPNKRAAYDAVLHGVTPGPARRPATDPCERPSKKTSGDRCANGYLAGESTRGANNRSARDTQSRNRAKHRQASHRGQSGM